MEKIRVSKVEDVTLWKQGIRAEGTLRLMPHHLIFLYQQLPSNEQTTENKPKARELWITYPMIASCTYRPAPSASHQSPSIRLRCRDFTYVALHFALEERAREVYESIRSLTCKLGKLDRLYAFSYHPQRPEKALNGWKLYDARKEFQRMGVDADTSNGWRLSDINANYEYSPTYPAVLGVPSSISDNVLKYAGPYRSRARIPALAYIHPVNNCSITRSSQPMVGVRNNRNAQDEKLVTAIFSSSKPTKSLSASSSMSMSGSEAMEKGNSDTQKPQTSTELLGETEALEDEAIKRVGEDLAPSNRIYGAQQSNLIVDARPTVNAYAQTVAGNGTENMEYYKGATKAYLGIDNIHVMRDSLSKVIDALKDSDVTPLSPNREQLVKSGWLKHIMNMLDGASLIARQVGLHHSHVLIHCSDGWDRTSQLSALSQLCLDPYYRTLDGFIILIEKDWLSFGHMFRHRSGFLSSEKWFEVENERVGGRRNVSNGTDLSVGGGAENAFQNAFLKAKGFFNKETDSKDAAGDSDGETQPYDSSPNMAGQSQAKSSKNMSEEHSATKVKETSPVFHQFIDATYQLIYQYPTRFEFNEYFLRRLLYHLYSCQYGTFLYDNEKQRIDARVSERTRSVWDYFLSRREMWLNDKYDAQIDDGVRGKERLIFPRVAEVRWWEELFRHKDMNAPMPVQTPGQYRSSTPLSVPNTPNKGHSRSPSVTGDNNPIRKPAQESEAPKMIPIRGDNTAAKSDEAVRKPVLTGLETAEESFGPGVPASQAHPSGSTAPDAVGLIPPVSSSPQSNEEAADQGSQNLAKVNGVAADLEGQASHIASSKDDSNQENPATARPETEWLDPLGARALQ